MEGNDALRVLEDAAAACAIELDAEGRIRGLNEAAERLFGCRRADVLGRPLVEVSATALLRARSRAHESARELDAFSHTVSHDLRAPLRHIEGFSRLLVEDAGGTLNENARHDLDILVRAGKRLALMLEDLLLYSRAGRAELQLMSVDMKALVEEVVRPRATPGRVVAWDVAALPPARGDRALLREVWTQLVDNALKFTRNVEQPAIAIGASATPEHVEYVIRDNGTGFNMQHASKLFGVFQRLHHESEFEGAGIGLALVRRIVTRLGGSVRAEAEPGKGAAIYFTLPAA